MPRLTRNDTRSHPLGRKLVIYQKKDIDRIPNLARLSADEHLDMMTVASVLPFRVNNYVVEDLIDWSNIPEDPIYQMTFPQVEMLGAEDFTQLREMIRSKASERRIARTAHEIQMRLNPHPAGQLELNVPRLHGKPLSGMQHKYRETLLFFPSQGQTCHSYCTYCFRWAQFVGIDELKFAAREAELLVEYLKAHPEVTDVLFTGGDPMIMRTKVLRRYIEPLLVPELDHLVNIRIGTKAPAYWPYRFTTDADADDLLRLFEQTRAAGRHLALMAHYSHPRELEPPVAQEALRRILATGAGVRCQAPLIRRVNDDAKAWIDLWQRQVLLGAVPYYMFIERDTGPKNYFEVPLVRAERIFQKAYRRVSGLARTVRGPSMSATPGKVVVDGEATIHGQKVMALKFLQARDPAWVNRVFFAEWDETASWLGQLRPAFGEKQWWFEPVIDRIRESGYAPPWGDRRGARKRMAQFGHVEWE